MNQKDIETWRLIDSGTIDPAYTMAVDDALLLTKVKYMHSDNTIPKATLHLYSRNPPAVSLGYFQKVNDEVQADLCEKLGIKILRRGSGGGAIYTDSNQIIYGLVISGETFGTIPKSFNIISKGVIESLKLFGLSPEFKGLNDIIINEKKISGCAQTRKNNIILQHGTIILDVDMNKISRILTPSSLKFKDKDASDITERMTSLSQILGYAPTYSEVKKKLILGFERAFSVKIEPGTLTSEEKQLVEDLLKRKYHNSEWNFRR